MITLFVISWVPYAIIAQLGITGLHDYITPLTAEFPVMIAKSSAVWNPIVYALMHPRYRAALSSRLPACLRVACGRKELQRQKRVDESYANIVMETVVEPRHGSIN